METMTNLHISQHALEQWLYQMVNSKIEVFAPVHDGEKTDFRLLAFGDKVADDYVQTTQSAKRFAFPKAEKLFSYRKEGKDVTLQERNLNDFPEIVLWKVRPCDAAGFAPLTGIFNWDYKDNIYNARRDKITLVSFSCTRCDEYCFCTSVHGGPGNTEGSDIQVTELPDRSALVEILTPKGKSLIERFVQETTPADGIDKETYLASVPVRFKLEQLREKLEGAFDSPIWKQQSERCLGCGACAICLSHLCLF